MKPPDGFRSMPERLAGELDARLALATEGRVLKFYVSFFDDWMCGIGPNDLVLIGAPSGLGKTDLALSIAVANARNGKRVHFFALEAENDELERRTKFAMLARLLHQIKDPRAYELNYSDWYFGRCEEICGKYNDVVDRTIGKNLGKLYTFYRGEKFDPADLARAVLEVHHDTDLIVVDHLHYVDVEDDNEARGLTDVVKTCRDISLRIGKPIILVAHLRKRDQRVKQLIATLDDFHGSSNITKICTHVVTLERANQIKSPVWWLAPTYLAILKDRRVGVPGYVAVTNFDRRLKMYEDDYSLGRISATKWTPTKDPPAWAKRHRS